MHGLVFSLCLTALGIIHGGIAKAGPADRAPAKSIPCEAVVQKYEPSAMWDHMAGGGFAAYDAVLFKIIVPEEKRGQEVRVYFESGSVAGASSLRRPGSRFRFDFDFALLKQGPLFGGALEKLELVTAGVPAAQTMPAANPAVVEKGTGTVAAPKYPEP
jgi:hypothetical protein